MDELKRFSHNAMEIAIQGVTNSTKGWLKDKLIEHLEENIHFTQKADILAFALTSINDKVKYVDEQIQNLEDYKKSLTESSIIAKEVGATVFTELGITKIDGTLFSSITKNNAFIISKLGVKVEDESMLFDAGYYTKDVDIDKIIKTYRTGSIEDVNLLKECCSFRIVKKTIPSRLFINKHKFSNNDKFFNNDAA